MPRRSHFRLTFRFECQIRRHLPEKRDIPLNVASYEDSPRQTDVVILYCLDASTSDGLTFDVKTRPFAGFKHYRQCSSAGMLCIAYCTSFGVTP